MPAVVTSCSMTKSRPAGSHMCAGDLPRGNLAFVAAQWKSRLAAATRTCRADELYGGRNFALSRQAASISGSSLWIVSAGLGLLPGTEMAPPYNATMARSTDCILGKVTHRADAQGWWHALTGGRPLANMIANAGETLTLVALPGSYLKMVEADLLGLPDPLLATIRILTGAQASTIDPRLRRSIMPYDTRLDGPDSSIRGTRVDFAGRALHDFCVHVQPAHPDASLEQHRDAVASRLQSWRAPLARPKLPRHDDERILQLIRLHWDRALGQTSRLIRLFRDELNVPCEARRMRRLADSVRMERH